MKVADLREREEDLGFRPEDAVRWLSPRELWRAGVKVVLSSVMPTSDYIRPQTNRRPNEKIQQLNKWIKEYAAKHGAKMIDAKFVDFLGSWKHLTYPIERLEEHLAW